MKLSAIVCATLATASNAVLLTPDNWDTETAGKTVFLKMFAPWCGHCKRLKPHWDKLMEEYEGHATVLVGDVDCTAAGKPICDQNDVRGFPTVKYGDPAALEDYQGGREFSDIQEFAKELKPTCSPFNLDLCTGEAKASVEKYMKLAPEELDALVEIANGKIKELESTFESELEKLQASYQEISDAKDSGIKNVKDSGLGVMKAVKAWNASKSATE